ncbi:acyl-CoA dehydrogenase family protein [Microbacterium sp. X-17]|uniref:acyl-CoA dehydrogenase family protein n=1 Tax=Microbacterium sp. X-17 TaxID=3144404 RepID=UPI0031F48DBA
MTTPIEPMPSTLSSFDDPGVEEFVATVRERLAAAIPEGWAEAKHLLEFHPRALEVRKEWDRNRTAAGFGAISWPREYGGNGFSPVEQVLFNETWGELEAPQPFNLVGYFLAGRAISGWGTPEQKERFLPRILSGEDLWCEGFSEPAAGSDMAGIQTRATKTANGWRIQGQKIWTTYSPYADRMYCLTRSSETAPKRHNLSVFLLDMHNPGVEVQAIKDINGLSEFGQVFIDAEVDEADMLGAEGDGWKLSSLVGANRQKAAFGAMDAVSTRAAEMGAWARALSHCFDAAKPGIRELRRARYEEIMLRARAYRWQIRRGVSLALADRDPMPTMATLKLYSTQLAQDLTELAVDLGCEEHAEYWRSRHIEFRKLTIAGGPSEIHRNIIANRVLGLGPR